MDLSTYQKLVYKESNARKHLTKKYRKKGGRFYTRCHHLKLYKLSSGLHRCAMWKNQFSRFLMPMDRSWQIDLCAVALIVQAFRVRADISHHY